MQDRMDLSIFNKWLASIQKWVELDLLTVSTGTQAAAIAIAFIVALILANPARQTYLKIFDFLPDRWRVAVARPVRELSLSINWLVLQIGIFIIAEAMGWPDKLLDITVSLLTAWVVIRIASQLIRDPVWANLFACTAWGIAALSIVDLLSQTVELLDAAALNVGDVKISALTVIQGVLTLIVLLWLATLSSRLLEQKVQSLPNLTPSVQVLIGKMIKIVFVMVAILVAINTAGIDLTAFAVFSGALGVGVGFGLQKVVSNFISGIILLLDRSVKPGDTIVVAGYYGRVDSLGARYASVITRDGVEHLVPNEEFINTRVENWSHSNETIRLKTDVGVHYDSDLKKAMELCLDAAANTDRILTYPKPVCLLTSFGDSSIDLQVRFWINDPMNGRANVISNLLLGIWERFAENGIQIPYPQRDLHLRTSDIEPAKEVDLPV
ncbi:MAG: mechanosensitive ion channel domain-containing protein [Pseudomonadota bacterium]|nr:mechanosensitive ion channel domain-containing protein [Pseudomonadota bacterium]